MTDNYANDLARHEKEITEQAEWESAVEGHLIALWMDPPSRLAMIQSITNQFMKIIDKGFFYYAEESLKKEIKDITEQHAQDAHTP